MGAKDEAVIEVTLPWNDFTFRHYQLAVWDAVVNQNKKFIVVVAHRRSGKDLLAVNINYAMAQKRRGTYYHVFPYTRLAKDVIWNGMTDGVIGDDGTQIVAAKKFLDYFPAHKVEKKLESDLSIEFTNGSRYVLRGASDINKNIGTNPIGITLSEYAITEEQVESFFLPIIANNKGFILYIYTPRGHNHGYRLLQRAHRDIEKKGDDSKYAAFVQPVSYTKAIDNKTLAEFKETMAIEIFRQEFFCDFNIGLVGSYYSEYVTIAQDQGRIGNFPYNPDHPVHTAWDLGHADSTSIVFFQIYDGNIYIIDYYEANGKNIEHYAKMLRQKPYAVYGNHFAPHDIKVNEWFAGKTRLQTAAIDFGINFKVLERWDFQDGVDAVRRVLPKVYFHAPDYISGNYDINRLDTVDRLIRATKEYKKGWNDATKSYTSLPVKDWTSHACDALRYLAMSIPDDKRIEAGKNISAVLEVDSRWDMSVAFGSSNEIKGNWNRGTGHADDKLYEQGEMEIDF